MVSDTTQASRNADEENRMTDRKMWLGTFMLALAMSTSLAACDTRRDTGDKIEDAAEDVEDKVEDAAD
jgi:predicted small secreted protein